MGKYGITVSEYRIAGQAAVHIIILEVDDQNNKIGEIDGGPADRTGNAGAYFNLDPAAFRWAGCGKRGSGRDEQRKRIP